MARWFLPCLLVLLGCSDDSPAIGGGGQANSDGSGVGTGATLSTGTLSCATTTCDTHAACDESRGEPTCTCLAGFEGNGAACTDVDECARGAEDLCGAGTCVNEAGSYSCLCGPGQEPGSDGRCEVVDECAGLESKCAPNCSCTDTPDESPVCTCAFTQSSRNDIVAGVSASCKWPSNDNAENSYYRVFDLSEHGVHRPFTVSQIVWGVEKASSPNRMQSVTLLAHTLTGSELLLASLTELGRSEVAISDGSLFAVTSPLRAVAPAESPLVIEIAIPDSEGTGGTVLLVGANGDEETGATYFRAPDCLIEEPTTVSNAGIPNTHIVMTVVGSYSP